MFSARSGFSLETNRFSRALAGRATSGAPILDLTLSNPTRAGFAAPGVEAVCALADARALDYDPRPAGRLDAREAVAKYYAEQGHEVAAGRIFLTASTSEAYAFLFKLLCDSGDQILLPQPSYPLVDYLAALESVDLARYRLEYHDRWQIDMADLAAAITPRTRAVALVSPNNPTGNISGASELKELDQLAAKAGLALVSDEVFSDFLFADRQTSETRFVPAAIAAGQALTFSLSGISKACGLPQLKLGWIVVGGPDDLVAEALARLEIIADTFLSVSTPVQVALPRLLASRHAFQDECRERLRANRAAIAASIASIGEIQLLGADGGWYACLRVPRTHGEEELALQLLIEDGVAVHPGYFFDFPTEAYLVLSLLSPPKQLSAGLEHIIRRVIG